MSKPGLQRAYAVLTIKAVDDGERVITGTATTPEPDRYGDIVEPMGVKYANPLPLLWQHKHDQPIGTCEFKKPTAKGIEFRASLPRIAAEGVLKNRIDEAWESVKAGLVRGASIGFRPMKYAFLDDGGVQFIESEVYELSLVTIPANADCTIQSIKSIDAEQRAASGHERSAAISSPPPPPGASGTPNQPASRRAFLFPKEKHVKKTIKEQLAEFEAKRAANLARMQELTTKAADEGRTLDDSESEEFDGLQSENEQIDKHLPRLKLLEKSNLAAATPVAGNTPTEATNAREGRNVIQLKEKLEPGQRFARYVRVMAWAHRKAVDPEKVARQMYPNDPVVLGVVEKATVPAGSTASGNWAANLVGEETSVFADFIEYLRPQTILGRFGNGGIPALNNVPFRVPLIGQTTGGAAAWVGEGKAKPLTRFGYERRTLEPLKIAAIAVLTEENLRDSSPSSEILIRNELARVSRERADVDFIDPAKAASAGVSPASILNGIASIASSGSNEAAVRADLKALWSAFIGANLTPSGAVYIMSSLTALSLSLMVNSLGQPTFPGITMNGGTLLGIPVITSEYVPGGTGGSIVALVNAADIYFADDGDVMLDMSREASLEMSDAPAHDSVTPTPAQLVSMFQTNSVAFRAERTLNWARRRDASVQYLTGVSWG